MSEQFENAMEAPAAEAALPLPGGVLRSVRQARGYSLAEVAQALKFSPRQIEALENDDYSILTGTTFVRGFVRSYARYLRLDEGPLLAALEPQAPVAAADVSAVEGIGTEMPVGGSDGNKRAYGLAAAVLLLGIAAWFVWQEQASPAAGSRLTEPPPDVMVSGSDTAPAAVAPSSVTPAESAPAAVTPDAPAMLQPNVKVTPAASSGDVAAAPESQAVAAHPNDRQMLLAFSGVSWVEVRDASNRIIFSGNSTPDTRQALRGRPPFELVIGNAQSVKLRYEDRNIDLQPHTRVDVARLTLDDNTK